MKVLVGDIWRALGVDRGQLVEITRSDDEFGIEAQDIPRKPGNTGYRMWIYQATFLANWELVARIDPAAIKPVIDPDKYPHICPRCTQPAYRGAFDVDCSSSTCPTKRA